MSQINRMIRLHAGTMDPITVKCPENDKYNLRQLIDIVSRTYSKKNDEARAAAIKELENRSIVHDSHPVPIGTTISELQFVLTPTNTGDVYLAELHFQEAASGGC